MRTVRHASRYVQFWALIALATSGCAAGASTTGPALLVPSGTMQAVGTGQGTQGNAIVCRDHAVYQETFFQDFNNDRSWRQSDGGVWATEYPWGRTNPGAKDAAYHIDGTQGLGTPLYDPFKQVNGNLLAIQALPVTAVSGLTPKQISGYQYVSGVISTAGPDKTAFRQQWGYYEVRAKLPLGQGFWPSFWMLDSWGGIDEIDVFEFLGNDPTTIYESGHYADGKGTTYPFKVRSDPTKSFHTYGVLVTPTIDTFYVDGIPTHGIPNVAIDSMYFMVSFSIGGAGSWPGPPNSSTPWPSYLYLQYFHAFGPTKQAC